MEHTKKMILVDPEWLKRQQQQQNKPPVSDILGQNISTLDQELTHVLQDNTIPALEKARRYEQALHRYRHFSDDYRQKPIGKVTLESTVNPTVEADVKPVDSRLEKIENRVLASVPKTMHKKARLLLEHLKEDPDLEWNERAQLVYGGVPVEGSNMSDLVNDVLRARKKVQTPQGWQVFARALKRANVPRELIGNIKRWDYLQQHRREEGSLKDSTPSLSSFMTTPALSSTRPSRSKVRQRRRERQESPVSIQRRSESLSPSSSRKRKRSPRIHWLSLFD